VSVVLVIVFIIITISIRVYVRQACYKKTDKITGGLTMLPKRKIKIRPKKLSNYLIATFGYFFCLSFSLLGSNMAISYYNPSFLIILSTVGFMYLIMNTTFINIGDAKVKYLENKYDEERSTHESN